jgi:capsular polysaccharide transport system permease protein
MSAQPIGIVADDAGVDKAGRLVQIAPTEALERVRETATPIRPLGQPGKYPKRTRRLSWRWVTFILMAALPTVVVALYMAFFATNQYVAEFRFNLRQSNPSAAPVGAITGGSSAAALNPSVVWDSYAIVQYIKSREIVESMEKSIDFRGIYQRPDADWVARLKASATAEEMTDYWNDMVDPFFDMTTGVISVKVRAFSPQETFLVSKTVLQLAEQAINNMSVRARRDTVQFAEGELDKAEAALKKSQLQVLAFRNKSDVIDPTKQAEITATGLGKQRDELLNMRAKYESMHKFLDPSSPTMRVLQSEIAAKEAGIQQAQTTLTREPRDNSAGEAVKTRALSAVMTDYQELSLEQTLREKAYALAQDSLQRARIDAARQQLYLNAFVHPQEPQESLYPKRIRAVLVTFLCGMAAWMIGCLAFYAVRDHLT